MRRTWFLFLCLCSTSLFAQDSATHVFTLGQVVVTPGISRQINAVLGARQLQDFAGNDVSKALNLLPGVNLSAVGSRNKAMVYVRGFDLRQAGLEYLIADDWRAASCSINYMTGSPSRPIRNMIRKDTALPMGLQPDHLCC